MAYRVELTASAVRDLGRIPPRYTTAMLEFVYGPLAGNPRRVGKPLVRDFVGLHAARRGDYRVIYEVLDDDHVVVVHRVDHRARAYRPR